MISEIAMGLVRLDGPSGSCRLKIVSVPAIAEYALCPAVLKAETA
jgi:hypothetical protein